MSRGLAGLLPDFPWDSLDAARHRASAHPDGIVDLSVGTPVDPTPEIARVALSAAADAPGYPTTWGTPALRTAIIGYLTRRWGAVGLTDAGVLPVIGTKELVALLPTLLGVGAGQTVVIPGTAYPTYDVGGRIAGATVVACDDPAALAELRPGLVWINSPANPHGEILDPDRLRAWVDAARAVGAVLASDECYGEFGWDAEPMSVLHPDINAGSLDGLLAVHSLSKRSNAAGYRAGFVAGDPEIVRSAAGGAQARRPDAARPRSRRPWWRCWTTRTTSRSSGHATGSGVRCCVRPSSRPATASSIRRARCTCGAPADEDCRASVDHLAGLGILVAPGRLLRRGRTAVRPDRAHRDGRAHRRRRPEAARFSLRTR